MQLIAGPRSIELTEVVLCSQGLFSEGPDKVGAVLLERESGRLDGRTALALVQTARALAAEYPGDVIAVGPEAGLTAGEHPFATILGCSDSRVAPEWIFDAGLGELFVVRVAGNVLSPEVAGSVQYAGAHLRTPLLVVLGHEGCGAIQAALQVKCEGAHLLSRIQLLVDDILPALAGLDPDLPPPERLAQAVERNVRWTVRAILESPEGQARLAEGWMKIVGAVYEIETGRVRFLEP